MKSMGMGLIVLGVVSSVLHFANMEYWFLIWIENWGQGIGWGIRGAMVVVGGVLALRGGGKKSDD